MGIVYIDIAQILESEHLKSMFLILDWKIFFCQFYNLIIKNKIVTSKGLKTFILW